MLSYFSDAIHRGRDDPMSAPPQLFDGTPG
jgi:hypothetical protein